MSEPTKEQFDEIGSALGAVAADVFDVASTRVSAVALRALLDAYKEMKLEVELWCDTCRKAEDLAEQTEARRREVVRALEGTVGIVAYTLGKAFGEKETYWVNRCNEQTEQTEIALAAEGKQPRHCHCGHPLDDDCATGAQPEEKA